MAANNRRAIGPRRRSALWSALLALVLLPIAIFAPRFVTDSRTRTAWFDFLEFFLTPAPDRKPRESALAPPQAASPAPGHEAALEELLNAEPQHTPTTPSPAPPAPIVSAAFESPEPRTIPPYADIILNDVLLHLKSRPELSRLSFEIRLTVRVEADGAISVVSLTSTSAPEVEQLLLAALKEAEPATQSPPNGAGVTMTLHIAQYP